MNIEELAIKAGVIDVVNEDTYWTVNNAIEVLGKFAKLVLVESTERLAKEQVLAHQQVMLDEAGINIVTCGSCGDPFVVKPNEESHTCPYCGSQGDPCDFPDLFH